MLLLPPRRRGGVSGSSDGGGFIHWPGFTPPDDDDTPGGGKDDEEEDKTPQWPDVGTTYNDGQGNIYTRTENGVELTSVAVNEGMVYIIPEKVTLKGRSYPITGFGPNAFTKAFDSAKENGNEFGPGIDLPASLCNTESGLNTALQEDFTNLTGPQLLIIGSAAGYEISEGAFEGNTAIVSVCFFTKGGTGSGVTTIKENAFKDCTRLTVVILTKDIVVEKEAFSGCSSLQGNENFQCGVFYEGTKEDWKKLKEDGKIDPESGLPDPIDGIGYDIPIVGDTYI